MTALLLLRHGPTAWNEEGRLQGRSDQPLSAAGRDAVAQWRLPAEAAAAAWICSPLKRARETAEILHRRLPAGGPKSPDLVQDARLIEADWGDWEGRRLDDLRAAGGSAMAANEARGLDFRPPNGESPRAVQKRVLPWLREQAGEDRDVVAVTHKGVIRAIYALASGWDMRDRPPVKLKPASAHRFALAADGQPSVAALNIALDGA